MLKINRDGSASRSRSGYASPQVQAWLTRRSWQAAKALSDFVNILATLIAKVLSEPVDKRCPLSLLKPIPGRELP
ncbi:hypothetical protein [Streptomyces tuirus]